MRPPALRTPGTATLQTVRDQQEMLPWFGGWGGGAVVYSFRGKAATYLWFHGAQESIPGIPGPSRIPPGVCPWYYQGPGEYQEYPRARVYPWCTPVVCSFQSVPLVYPCGILVPECTLGIPLWYARARVYHSYTRACVRVRMRALYSAFPCLAPGRERVPDRLTDLDTPWRNCTATVSSVLSLRPKHFKVKRLVQRDGCDPGLFCK